MYNARLVYARDGSNGGSKLSKSTIVVIVVVCVAVFALVLVMFLWRMIFRAFRRDRSAPLPPVQQLAHYREQQLAAFADRNSSRPTTIFEYENSQAGISSQQLLHATSTASLIPGSFSPGKSGFEDVSSAENSLPSSPLSADHLPVPNRSFGIDDDRLNRVGSINSSDSPETVSPSLSIPFSETSSSVSHATSTSTRPLASRPGNSSSPSRPARSMSGICSSPQYLSRPMSIASSLATSHSTRSRVSTIRGAPHSPHSNIRIILPSPLAPELYPYTNNRGSYVSSAGDQGERRSALVDQWMPAGTRSSSMGSVRRRAADSRASSRPPSKLSQSVSAGPISRRAQSQPRPDVPPFPHSLSSRGTPSSDRQRPTPVPQLPSAYGEPFRPVADGSSERGRSRQVVPWPAAMSRSQALMQNEVLAHPQEAGGMAPRYSQPISPLPAC